MPHAFQRIRCDEVNIGHRHRKDLGEIEVFANQIKARGGLFQPIVVKRSGKQYKLLAGERRLRAQRDELHEVTIPAVIVEAESRLDELLFEKDENETHKPFNPIEAAELGREIEKELGNRQGKRSDIMSENLGPVGPKLEAGKTTEIAAELAGFKSRHHYEDAKKVVEKGADELKEAVADKTISVTDAAAVADKPKRGQRRAVRAVRSGQAKTARAALAIPSSNGRVEHKPTGAIKCSACDGKGWITRETRDELWDAVVEVTGADSKVNGSRIGKLCKLLLSADPPYNAADIRKLPGIVKERWPNLKFSFHIGSLEKYVGWIRQNTDPGSGMFDSLKRFMERHQ